MSQVPKVVSYLDSVRRIARPGSNIIQTWEHDHEALPGALPYLVAPRPQAGFPSPAQDYIEEVLDLRDLLVRNPPATFYARLQGDSLHDRSLIENDVLVVDRSLTPRIGQVVVAVYDGDILVKIWGRHEKAPALLSANAAKADQYKPLPITEGHECEVWGVVTGVVRKI